MPRAPVLGALLVVAALYGWQLGSAPSALAGDEVLFAIHGRSIAQTGCDLNGRCWPLLVQIEPELSSRRWYQPVLFYLEAVAFLALPDAAWTVRVPMVVIGLINIVLMFLVGKELTGRRDAAVAGALVLASAPAHFFYSRQAADYLLPVPFVLVWMWCVLRMMRAPSLRVATGAGLALGLGTFSYVASWFIMPALLVLTIPIIMAGGKGHRLRLTTALLAGYGVALLPAVVWLASNPDALTGLLRHYEVASGDSAFGGIRRWLHYYRLLDLLLYFWVSFNPVHLFFIASPDLLNGTRAGGVFLLPAAVLLVLGAVCLLSNWDRRIFLVAGLLIGVTPAALNNTPATIQRELTMLPFAAAIAAVGVTRLRAVAGQRFRAVAGICLAVMALQFSYFLYDYFGDYSRLSAGRYDPLNIKALGGKLREIGGGADTPAILLTMGDTSGASGAGGDAYWRFYATYPENAAVAAKTSLVPLSLLPGQPVAPGSLVVTATVSDPAMLAGGLPATPVGSVDLLAGQPVLTIWRVRAP
jgi:4-amino-4-deoxy-L-arabinose transferase-like glycosyltransferase